MKMLTAFALVVAVLLVGCMAMVPLGLVPSAKLATYGGEAAKKIVSEANDKISNMQSVMQKAIDDATAPLKAEIVKLKAAGSKSDWIFGIGTAFFILTFVGCVFLTIYANKQIGVAGAAGSIFGILLCVTFWNFGWQLAIGCAVLLGILVLVGTAYAIRKLFMSAKGATAAVDNLEAKLTAPDAPEKLTPKEAITMLKTELASTQDSTGTKGVVDFVRGKVRTKVAAKVPGK